MALSGTLDSFALPDVLRLLASSKKTGRLRVIGDRGGGSVWVDDGEIVSTELTVVDSIDSTHAEVLFLLIRLDAGSFTFEVDSEVVNASEPDQLEPVLVAAEQMLIEWRGIEEVVPSLDAFVTLSPEPTGGDVMIDAPRWRCIAAVASGATADSVGATLGQSELEVCRTIKELVEFGLMDVSEAPPEPEVVTPAERPDQVEPVEQTTPILEDPVAEDTVDGADEAEADFAAIDGVSLQADEFDDTLADRGDVGVVSESLASEPLASEPSHVGGDSSTPPSVLDNQPFDGVGQGEPDQLVNTAPGLAGLIPETDPDAPSRSTVEPLAEFAPGPDETVGASADMYGADAGQVANQELMDDFFGAATAAEEAASDLDPAEMARQLASLSPKAAKAVAAAAKASTDAERDEALAAVEAEDDTVNRGLLLKFLGSVDG